MDFRLDMLKPLDVTLVPHYVVSSCVYSSHLDDQLIILLYAELHFVSVRWKIFYIALNITVSQFKLLYAVCSCMQML